MAREGVYRAGANPGGTPTFGGADGGAFGAIGRGLQDAGDSVDRIVERERQRDREEQATTAAVDFAKLSGELDVGSQAARQTAPAGARGHTQAQLEAADKSLETFIGGIRDPKVRNAYRERAAELRARIYAREDGWERSARIEHFVEQVDEIGTQHANNVASNPEAASDGGVSVVAALSDVESSIGLLEDLPEDTKRALVREQQRKVAGAWGNQLVTANPAGLTAILESGTLNPYLEPEDIDRLRSGAMVELRRAEAADRARTTAEEAAAREKISLFQKRISAGDQPSDEEFAQHKALAEQYGLEPQEFDLGVAQSGVQINRETRDWTPVQFDQEINTLHGKGDKRTTAENVRLAQLEKIRGARVSEFVDNPQGHAARTGNPAPPVDWGNPSQAQIDARVAWARGVASSTGLVNPPYLSAEELRPLRERIEQGPAGQLQVAQQLRGQFGAGIGGEIARQLDDDKNLQLMVGMSSSAANWYGRGISARQRNPKLFDRDAALEVFGDVAEAIPQDLRTPVFEAATNIAAALTDGSGGDEFNEATFRRAIGVAMGGTGPLTNLKGGVGEWRERSIWLPPEVNQADFERRWSRADGDKIIAAAVDARGRPTKVAPRYMTPDGGMRPLKISEIKELELETVSPGVYRLRGRAGGVLVAPDGKPWQFDIRRLP